MLNQLSWTNYFEIVLLLTAIYYLFVLFRYYRQDAYQMFQSQSERSDQQQVPKVLRYEEQELITEPAPTNHTDFQADDQYMVFPREAAELNRHLIACIGKAAGKPFAPAVLIPQIKKILQDNAALSNIAQRPGINELIVRECENTGTALLTEDEVDTWWPES